MYLAERALHHRMRLACSAAAQTGLPGDFQASVRDGLFLVRATDPALGFLSTITGVTGETVPAAIDLLTTGTLVAPAALASRLHAAGLTPAGARPLAVHRLDGALEPDPAVVAAGADFAELLVAGYEVDGVVAEFIRAEHRSPAVHRFLLREQGRPIAAAAMTVHGQVAVLGGASTMRAYRGRGAQSRLVRHRLAFAQAEGCTLAVATASPGSVSAGNLRKAGFRVYDRQAWAASGRSGD